MLKRSWGRILLLNVLAAALTAVALFLGAPFMRVLRAQFGSVLYWISGILLFAILCATQMQPLGFLLAGLWLTIGIYSEMEQHGHAGKLAGFLSVLTGTCFLLVSAYAWSRFARVDLMASAQESIQSLLDQLGTASGAKPAIDASMIIQQTPSIAFLMMLLSLGFGLMLESRASNLVGLPHFQLAGRMKLLDYQLPDFCVWIVMTAFLFSFLKTGSPGLKIAATNVFNIMMGLYFFQGLAILESAFAALKTGFFWRFMAYFFIVGQLFFILSGVGIIDYWVNFRARLKRVYRPEHNPKREGQL